MLKPRTILGYRKNGAPIWAIAGGAPTDYLDRLNDQAAGHLSAIDVLVQRAKADNDRDLTAEELAEVEQHEQAHDGLQPQIERFKKLREASVASVERAALPPAPVHVDRVQVVERTPAAAVDAGAGAEPIFRSAGEAASAMIKAHKGDRNATETVQRALAVQTTADTPGLLPVQTIGDLRGVINTPRYILAEAKRLPLPPSGMQFRRPKVTQHSLVAKQGAEKTEVASQKMTVGFDAVDLGTFAGAVNISIQDVERTTPGALDLLYADLANSYGVATEADMAATLVAAATPNKITLAANATLATLWSRIFDAASAMVSGTRSKILPNVVFASVDQWARIGSATTPINAQNAVAAAVPTELAAVLGNVRVVVAPSLPAGSIVVANTAALEYVEDERSPIRLQVPEPRILGYEVGVYGYFLSYVSDPLAAILLAA